MTGSLPQDATTRKASPMAEGLLWYFPNALAAVAAVSKAGNDQHNPGEPMHHARGKSMDHADCIIRHLVDAGTIDTDGQRHSAKVAWRALALLQEELEREEGSPLPRNAKGSPDITARKLYAETTAIHAVQDAKLCPSEADSKSRCCELLAECAREAQTMGLYADADTPEKSPIAGSRIATPAELAYLASFGPNSPESKE